MKKTDSESKAVQVLIMSQVLGIKTEWLQIEADKKQDSIVMPRFEQLNEYPLNSVIDISLNKYLTTELEL